MGGAGCAGEPGEAVSDAAAADAVVPDGAGADAALQEDGAAPDASGSPPPGVLELGGDIAPVHDPMVVAAEGKFYLFATGQGVATYESSDLQAWSATGPVFSSKPGWITTTDPNNPNHLWAPHVAHFGGQYHLYYSASSFGSNESCIGHATSPSLEPAAWADDGEAILCSSAEDNYNAIDPAAITDASGQPWLAFGSFWGGLKLFPLEIDGTRKGSDLYSIATRSNNAVEAPFLVRRGGFFYLFESVDQCCQGVDSTYRILVGRASSITGPYVDRLGEPLLSGGGTLVLEGDERWRGPGHNAILATEDGFYNVYHAYDADSGGVPTLRIAELDWLADDWPVSAGP